MTTPQLLRVLALSAPLWLVGPSVHAANELPSYEPPASHYSLELTGLVEAELVDRKVDAGDNTLSDAALMTGEPGERLVYTVNAVPYKTDNETGDRAIFISVGAPHARSDGEPVGAHVVINLRNDVTAGEYEIKKGFFEVQPGEVPVDVMVRTVSTDGEGLDLFAKDPQGRIRFEKADRESATGRFRFTIPAMGGSEGNVEVAGAFTEIPFTPAPVLEIAGSGALGPGKKFFEGKQFKKIDARRTEEGIRIETQREIQDESSLVFTLSEGIEPGTYRLGESDAISVHFGEQAASGTVTITRAGEAYGAEFELKIPHEGETGTFSGHFDYVRPVDSTSKVEYEL